MHNSVLAEYSYIYFTGGIIQMYDANFIQQLKQSNTSKDAKKTMERVKQL